MSTSHTLRVKCLKCGKEWRKEVIRKCKESDISSSLCIKCFGEIIIEKYKKKGKEICFGDISNCKKEKCKFKEECRKYFNLIEGEK